MPATAAPDDHGRWEPDAETSGRDDAGHADGRSVTAEDDSARSAADLLGSLDLRSGLRHAQIALTRLLGSGPGHPGRTPSTVVKDVPQLLLRHYGPEDPDPGKLPVLMVPPLAASATIYDLRPDYSMVAYYRDSGRPTYLADYGAISLRRDQALGLEHWVADILPDAVRTVSARHGGAAVHLVAWSLGGIMSTAAVAAQPSLPVRSVVAVGTPFNFDVSPVLRPLRLAREITGGRLGGTVIRVLGATPPQVNQVAFLATDPRRAITKPYFKLRNRHDEDAIAQVEAVDVVMDRMSTYPGRTLAQMYHRLVLRNELARGRLTLGDQVVDLRNVRIPVMLVAGRSDEVLGPADSVFHGEQVMPNAAVTRLLGPGGHVGVLTGRHAPTQVWSEVSRFQTVHDRA